MNSNKGDEDGKVYRNFMRWYLQALSKACSHAKVEA